MIIPEAYYRDTHLRPGEPNANARRQRLDSRVKRLRSSQLQPDLCNGIADTLEACVANQRCGLALCCHCTTADQRRLVQQTRQLWDPGAPLKKVTMVPAELQRQPGQLDTIKLTSIKRHLRRVFERAEVDHLPLVGFLDVSFNVHTDGLWGDHWQPHLEFITPTAHWETMNRLLRQQLTTSPSVKIPLLGVPIKDFEKQVSYAFKPTPVRKTYFEALSPKAHPHKQYLKGAQDLEFLLWLGLQPTMARTFMINVRAYGSRLVMVSGSRCHQGKVE